MKNLAKGAENMALRKDTVRAGFVPHGVVLTDFRLYEMGWRCEKCGKYTIACEIGGHLPPSWDWCKCEKKRGEHRRESSK